MTPPEALADLVMLSARIGADPQQIQGPGGNTSLKDAGTMWIKASGTELRQAAEREIFVAVDRNRARSEIDGAGDGTCRAALLDAETGLRPSIETTFHAWFDAPVVLHTHSVAALAHVTSEEGTAHALQKLADMDVAVVPYAKPGLPLTRAIADRAGRARVVLLRNHGLIVTGETVRDAALRLAEVELRLARRPERSIAIDDLWADDEVGRRARAGSYWPDHVVFCGPDLPERDAAQGEKTRMMLRCLADVLERVPSEWSMVPIGPDAEAELMDWDAEHYRRKLAGAEAGRPQGS